MQSIFGTGWLDILAQLAIRPRYVSELLHLLRLPQSTLSNRLRAIQHAGLIAHDHVRDGKHRGKNYLYYLVPEAIKAIASEIRAVADTIECLVLSLQT